MNYEHKYKEALERARSYYNNEEAKVGMTPIDLEEIFPELAESEDERIRKWLISQLNIKSNGTDSDLDIMIDKAIAWLEKQREQDNWAEELNTKIKELNKQCIEIIQKYVSPCDGCNNVKGCVTCVDGSEKVSPTWSEEDESIALGIESIVSCASLLNIAPDRLNKVRDWLESLKDRVQPKQQWSYEDEANLNNIIWLCNNCINGSETTWIPSQATRIKTLIERIKGTVFLQPKQEWSEEDDRMYNRIISFIPPHLTAESYTACIDWLKSLRLQNTWKPSDEQMDALVDALSLAKNCGEESSFDLRTLYEQLKKLKGE